MKKVIIMFIFVLLLVGCGSNNDEEDYDKVSKEKMISSAKEVDLGTLYNSFVTNKVKAEKDYVRNYYKISGYINVIENDYVTLSSSSKGATNIKVYLSKDELADLDREYMIVVVGKIKGYEDDLVIMKDAYYVTNEIVIDADIASCGYVQNNGYCETKYPVYYLHVSPEQIKKIYEKENKVKIKGNIPAGPQYGYPSGVNVVNVEIIE